MDSSVSGLLKSIPEWEGSQSESSAAMTFSFIESPFSNLDGYRSLIMLRSDGQAMILSYMK
jgi:hypothetical protein